MYKVVIWGTGIGYSRYFNELKYLEQKGEIEIIGVISNDCEILSSIDGYKFYKKSQMSELDFDYCIVTILNPETIYDEALRLGISRKKLIPARVFEIPYFNFDKYVKLKEEGITIFSNTCWADFCYNYLGLEFQSPTINMFMYSNDFNKFMSKIEYYLTKKPQFAKMRNEEISGCCYPVGKLDDIFLHFNHYSNFEDAFSAWERRKKRVTKNIAVVSAVVSLDFSEEIVSYFSKLPYETKLLFVDKNFRNRDKYNEFLYPVNFVKNKEQTLGMYCNGSAHGLNNWIDILSFLTHSKNYRRIS